MVINSRLKFNLKWLVITAFIITEINGCVAIEQTTPNLTYEGAYPPSIEILKQSYPLFVSELGKIPDINDGITEAEAKALDRIMITYNKDTAKFEKAFNIMFKVGNSEVRRYCVLLEAFYWYALESDTDELSNYLINYDKVGIDSEFPFLDGFTINRLLQRVWVFYDDTKWEDPNMVVARLNAPELVEYWLSRQFTYNWAKFRHPPPVYGQSAVKTIKIKTGVCYDAANFARECLAAAGYTVTGLNILLSPGGRVRAHSVCAIEMETPEGVRFFKIADTRHPGSFPGYPYLSYRAMAEDLAKEYGRHLDRYNVGLPAFHR